MQRMALIGAGFIGSVHARNLVADPAVDLVGIHDVDTTRARELAARSGTRTLETLDDVFDSGSVDAVFIASSTDSHAAHLRAAADAGVAVLCEKPIAPDLAEARSVTEDVRAAGISVMLDFNRRYDRDHAEVRRLVHDGAVGVVELVQMSSRGPSMPPLDYLRTSGGQFRDQTVHFFDLARWLTGEDPIAVSATGSALAEPRIAEFGDVDTSVCTLRLPSGALVQIDSVRRTGYGYDERLEVMGSGGLVESRRNRTGNVSRYQGGTVTDDGLHTGWFERVRPTYARALRAFVDALEHGTPMPVTLDDGLRAQAIADAATRSVRSRREERIDS